MRNNKTEIEKRITYICPECNWPVAMSILQEYTIPYFCSKCERNLSRSVNILYKIWFNLYFKNSPYRLAVRNNNN